MVPSTAATVVVFLLLVTPGIAFELLWQRTRPRRDESTFVEISRVLLAGVVFSGAAVATLVATGAVVSGAAVDLVALVRDGGGYVVRNPDLTIRTLAAVVILALLFAVAAHDLLTPPSLRRIAQETAWHTAFGRMAGPAARAFLSVQLKDGTTVTGYSAGYSTEPDPGRRDLLLAPPLAIRPPGAAEAGQLAEPWQVIVLSGAEISTIAAAYVGSARPVARPGRRRRLVAWLARHAWQASLAAALGTVALLLAGR
jgi:Family of unknown function (DUF6338)